MLLPSLDPFRVYSGVPLQLLYTLSDVKLSLADNNMRGNAVAVTSLKLGDSLLLSLQDETNLTGVEKQEYMVEK